MKRRDGFSLLEVLIAAAVLLGSAIVLTELARLGGRSAAAARDLDFATLACRTKLGEVLSGIAPPTTTAAAPLPEDPEWTWSLGVEPVRREALEMTAVRVTVARARSPLRKPTSVTLVRWIGSLPASGPKPFPATSRSVAARTRSLP